MKSLLSVTIICLLVQLATAPPPRRNAVEENKKDTSQEKDALEDFGLEYNRYLKEVVDLLENDPEFKKKLEEAQEADIRSGKIAKELEFVDHKVRSKLDEVKRQEIERLRHLAQKQYELTNGIETEHVKVSLEHLDHENPHTFEMEDLKKLIKKVSSDLSEADRKRHEEFKEYEMQKEYEKQQKLKHLTGSEREAFEKELQENETKHRQHEPLLHPGSKQQLKEVWEKQDHMENQEFDPKIFFNLHDLDGNGFWDHNEAKTLFLKELDKLYEAGAPEDDMNERMEEMERMREHVFAEADKNKDGLISFKEFLDKTKQPDFGKDSGWESIDEKPVYTQEEYEEFERKRQEEVQKMIQQGLLPPQPVYNGPYHHPQAEYLEYHPPPPPGSLSGHGYPQQGQVRYAQGYQMPPGSVPVNPNKIQQNHQGYPNQHPQQFQHPAQFQGYPSQREHHQQQGYHQNQVNSPSQGYQQNHPSQQGYQQNQGHPSQQGYQQNQVNSPQQEYQQNQMHQPQQVYQQNQAHQTQQGYQQNLPVQDHSNYPNPNQQQQHPSVQAHSNQGPQQNQQPLHDSNAVHPDPSIHNSEYSKSGGAPHVNIIDTEQKKGTSDNKNQYKR